MATKFVEFGEYLPDLPPFANPGATVAKNVFPQAIGYKKMRALNVQTTALGAYVRGHITLRDNDDNVFSYCGDADTLYTLNNLLWSDVSKAGGYSGSSTTTNTWSFAQFDQTLFAANFLDELQSLTLGSVSTLFADATGSPPKARYLAVVRDFLVLGNVDASGTVVPERVHWSGVGDPTTWAVSAATQADIHDFPDGGPVMGLTGGEYGIVFQANAVTRMSYVGSPVIFQMDKLLPNVGLLAAGSLVLEGNLVFFLSQDGFRMIQNGAESALIGANKVDQTLFAEIDYANLHRISGSIDPGNNYVTWAIPVAGNTGGLPNKLYIYDWINQKWSFADVEVELVTSAATSSATLEALDALVASEATELVTNGTFAADSDWTKGTGWTIAAGVATKAAGTGSDLDQSISITAGLPYYISYTVSGYSAGTLTPDVGGTTGTAVSANGTYTETIICGSSDTNITFTADASFAGNLDDVSVKASSLDALGGSLDSAQYAGGNLLCAGFDSAHKRGFFDGSALNGTVETQEFSLFPGRRALLRYARPYVDGAASSVTVLSRARQADSYTTGTKMMEQSSGRAAIRSDGLTHRIRVETSGDFDHALGVEVEGSKTGKR